MKAAVQVAKLIRATQMAWNKRWEFLVVFLTVFFLTFSTLLGVDFVPEENTSVAEADEPKATLSVSPLVTSVAGAFAPSTVAQGELPLQIEIPAIKLSAKVTNPVATDVASLDRALLGGAAVRYPTSGKLGENGNVVLFAHSSYLPIVNNQAYKLFNKIQDLTKGDRITVSSSGTAYVYIVDTVAKADANDDAIPLTVSGQKLTLSTCDSFGTKSDRFVVTATFVESHSLGN